MIMMMIMMTNNMLQVNTSLQLLVVGMALAMPLLDASLLDTYRVVFNIVA